MKKAWHGGSSSTAPTYGHLVPVFSTRLMFSTVPWVPQSRDPLHSLKRKFSVFCCWKRDDHPVKGSGRMDLGCYCFSNPFLPTCLCPIPSHSRCTWCCLFPKLLGILLCPWGWLTVLSTPGMGPTSAGFHCPGPAKSVTTHLP